MTSIYLCIYINFTKMNTQIKKWGNSLAVRLPKNILDKTNLKEGEFIFLDFKHGFITLKPAVKKETLEDFVNKITPQNRHGEVDWGEDVGNEIVIW